MIDWSKCVTIDSGSGLQDIEHHFRVFAGPGAGKTYWLINHVRNVLRKSKRLGITGKVACITYTNTGVEEIQKRLRQSAERVDVSTIHSFLYLNVVKPYAFLLKDEEGKYILNIKEMDGHIEHIPNPKIINDWKRDHKLYYLNNDRKVYECLINLDWCFEGEGLACLPRNRYKLKAGKYSIRKDALNYYKQYYWNLGQLHHEDVLYFSFCLIKEYPEILRFLRAKFPYIFVDEFQDTNPIQTYVIKKIAEEYTIVGVIGDLAQSIYGFQGACRQDFKEFILENGCDYKIENNRRSTENVINLLNHIRGNDIKQKSTNDKKGGPVKVLVGSAHDAIKKIEEDTDTTPTVLARRNDYVGQIRTNSDNKLQELWDDLRSIDKTWERTNFIYSLILSVELAHQKDFKKAITGLERNFRGFKDKKPIPKYLKRRIAVNCLQKAVNEWDTWKEANLREFNNHFIKYLDDEYNIKIGAAISSGRVKEFAESWNCKDFDQCLKLKDDRNNIRTIHKAKGGEYDTVLVALEEESHLDYIINPDIDNEKDDECRLYYVALSRAIDNLYICTPTLSEGNKKALMALDIVIS